MEKDFKALIEANGIARFGGAPEGDRAAELGRTIETLLEATQAAGNGLPLESEPSYFINVLNDLAED